MGQGSELDRHRLGIAPPWTVNQVEMDTNARRGDVWAIHSAGERWLCPECGQLLFLFDPAEEQVWRHLDRCAFPTHLPVRVPREECPEDGNLPVRVLWVEPNFRCTALFERGSIQGMPPTDTLAAAELLGINSDEAWGIQERAVVRGLVAKPPLAQKTRGVDDKAVGHRPYYATQVYHLEKVTGEGIGRGGRRRPWTPSSEPFPWNSGPPSRRWRSTCGILSSPRLGSTSP